MNKLRFPRMLTPKRVEVIERDSLAFEMREQIFGVNGDLIFDSEFYAPNALTNDGQASMLNVWARGTAAPANWLMLLNMTTGLAKTSTLSTITESSVINSNAYARQFISTGDWAAPVLSSGDQEIVAAQKTFGAFTGNVPVTHVGLVSIGSTFTGTFFLYVPTAYFTANSAARVFVSGESYLVTLRDKQI